MVLVQVLSSWDLTKWNWNGKWRLQSSTQSFQRNKKFQIILISLRIKPWEMNLVDIENNMINVVKTWHLFCLKGPVSLQAVHITVLILILLASLMLRLSYAKIIWRNYTKEPWWTNHLSQSCNKIFVTIYCASMQYMMLHINKLQYKIWMI